MNGKFMVPAFCVASFLFCGSYTPLLLYKYNSLLYPRSAHRIFFSSITRHVGLTSFLCTFRAPKVCELFRVLFLLVVWFVMTCFLLLVCLLFPLNLVNWVDFQYCVVVLVLFFVLMI